MLLFHKYWILATGVIKRKYAVLEKIALKEILIPFLSSTHNTEIVKSGPNFREIYSTFLRFFGAVGTVSREGRTSEKSKIGFCSTCLQDVFLLRVHVRPWRQRRIYHALLHRHLQRPSRQSLHPRPRGPHRLGREREE